MALRLIQGRAEIIRLVAILAVAACLLQPATHAQQNEINWYSDLEKAKQAAKESGKPIYMYIFSRPQKPCQRMVSNTFVSPAVASFLNAHFINCPIDAAVEANKEIVKRHGQSVAQAKGQKKGGQQGNVSWGSMPAHAFVNPANEPYLTFWGFMPPQAFLIKLKETDQIIKLKKTIDSGKADAETYASLGHALLNFGDYKHAREHLQKAKNMASDSDSGVLEDARLDLIILDIADDPQQSYKQLKAFVRDYPNTDRRLEVQYWKAVALCARQNTKAYRKALNELRVFEKLSPGDPEYDSRWAVEADKLKARLELRIGSGG